MLRPTCFCLFVGLTCTSAFATRYYVSPSGSGNGSTWAQASSLSGALSSAVSGDEVWVKSGTYAGPVYLVNGVKMIGGFAGTETAASQSNPAVDETILDGGTSDRAVISESNASSTILRGFTIKNGNDDEMNGGGGLLVLDSSTLFVQCAFKNSVAAYFGGAVAIRGNSAPQFINCIFQDNGTGSGNDVTPMGGGAVFMHSGTAVFTNCLFYGNNAGEAGALLVVNGTPTFRNCTIANNQATFGSGGGLFDGTGTAVVHNSILWGNTAVRYGPQVYSTGSPTVTYSNVEGGFTGTGNINADPQFINAGAGNFDIPVTSPCKDVANGPDLPADIGDIDWDASTTEALPKDLNLDSRKIQFLLDIGAYEAPAAIE